MTNPIRNWINVLHGLFHIGGTTLWHLALTWLVEAMEVSHARELPLVTPRGWFWGRVQVPELNQGTGHSVLPGELLNWCLRGPVGALHEALDGQWLHWRVNWSGFFVQAGTALSAQNGVAKWASNLWIQKRTSPYLLGSVFGRCRTCLMQHVSN